MGLREQGGQVNFERIAEFILGSTPGIVAMGFFLHRIEKKFNLLMVEHEILVQDYCDRNGKSVHDLPTRSRP